MVGTARDGAHLLVGSADVEAAVGSGVLERLKLRGRWLYHTPGLTEEEILAEAERAVSRCLSEWLLGTNPFLSRAAATQTEAPPIGSHAMTVLIQELCARGRILGLGLLNQSLQPYLAFFVPEDGDEVATQLQQLRLILEEDDRAQTNDLPEPAAPRQKKAWRHLLLLHAEFLGLGYLPAHWELRAW